MIVIHIMIGCSLCWKLKRLLKHWDIKYKQVIDIHPLDKEYPYVIYKEMEFTYKEIVKLIGKGELK